MSHGPPTPPPTSQTEIMDVEKDEAAKAAAAAAAETETGAPPTATDADAPTAAAIDSYQQLLPTIADLAAQQHYEELVRVAELADLNSEGNTRPTRLALITPLVLSYLILDKLPPARFALTRLPDRTARHPLAQALFTLLAAVWERSYTVVYERAEAITGAVDDPALSPLVDSMVTTFINAFRRRSLNLVQKAYTSITIETTKPYLGLPTDQIVPLMTSLGWQYDSGSQILTRGATAAVVRRKGLPSSLLTFDFVADAAAKLEA